MHKNIIYHSHSMIIKCFSASPILDGMVLMDLFVSWYKGPTHPNALNFNSSAILPMHLALITFRH